MTWAKILTDVGGGDDPELGVSGQAPLIAVYVVTFRRHQMLRRAVASVVAQTFKNIVVKVVNDDPEDHGVAEILQEFDDDRVALVTPMERRGATRNFNLVFEERGADYVALLEDDNWWGPSFLEEQLLALENNPDFPLVVGNERVWHELPDGSWLDTGRTIWPFEDLRTHDLRVEEICGSARVCNSSMLIKVKRPFELRIPDTVPLDVTEHFRERLLNSSILLNGKPLVNYAVTLKTARTSDDSWGAFQCLLIGSVFIATRRPASRRSLASRLWNHCGAGGSPRAVSLVATAVAFREARPLLQGAPVRSLLRFGVWIARRPSRLSQLLKIRRRFAVELLFLVTAPLTRHFADKA